jgi:3-dehydroquinate dehydratase-1
MDKIQIGPIELGKIPCITGVVDVQIDVSALKVLSEKGVTLLEFRFDLLGLSAVKAIEYVIEVRDNTDFGFIGTLRETQMNKADRLSFFEEVIPHVDCVDIEIFTDINRPVIEMAKGKTVIVSHHDFEKTPAMDELNAMADKAMALGADIVKIAATVNNEDEGSRLMDFTKACPYPLVSIAMGPLGPVLRVKAFEFGSLLTYAYIGNKPVASGQLGVDELSAKLRHVFPAFKSQLHT